MKHRTLILTLIAMLLCGSVAAGIKKSNLSVLYVGGSPDMNTFATKVDSTVLTESIKQRMASFEKFLKQYFKKVTVIHAEDYTPELSDDYDVTVMDGKPRILQPEIRETDATGKITKYVRAGYLPQNFDRPMVLIAELGSVLGERIGVKFDWYCLCLDADAHHIRTEHPIFQGPFPVEMTLVMKPTPEAGKGLPYFKGGKTPDSLAMWRVDIDGYQNKPGTRVGMVSRPGGFEDSPEAEFISGGVSQKSLDAVAISRHGNFFHWGFAASPDGMTEEAKNVFANAIVYISQFAGQTPIARKYEPTIFTRDEIKMFSYLATCQAYNAAIAAEKAYGEQMKKLQATAKAKQAEGKELEMLEEIALAYQEAPIKSYATYLQERFPDQYILFGTDEKGYADYFAHNEPYFLPDPRHYGFIIDEDARNLGIPNNDIRLLDKAISLWEAGGEYAAKGRRLLERYTLCRFETPAEWRAWFEANKERLFFTESGGWLFLVNTRDKSVPGNDYSVRMQTEKEVTPAASVPKADARLATDDKNPVRAIASTESLPNGNRLVTFRVKIHSGYHIYAAVADSDPYVVTTVEFRLPEGIKAVGDLQRPSAKTYNNAGTMIYEDTIEFRQEVSGTGSVTCILNFQCCNDQICMPPTTIEVTTD